MKKRFLQLHAVDRKIQWILAFTLVSFSLFLLVLAEVKKKQEASRLLVGQSNLVIRKVDTVGLVFSEAEAAARSYLLSRSQHWKNQTYSLQGLVSKTVAELATLSAADLQQQKDVEELANLCRQKEEFQQHFLNKDISSDSISMMISAQGLGPVISRTVKQLLKNIREDEQSTLSERMRQNDAGYRTGIYTALGGGIFSFLLVLAILLQLNFDIHRRKKAEENLVTSEEKYRNLIENAGAVMYTTDVHGNITFVNNKVAELTEYTLAELADRHYSFLIDPAWQEKVNDFYIHQFRDRVPATYLEFRIRTKSGKEKWVEQSAQLLLDEGSIKGFQCMVKDITEKKKVEKELNESENLRKQHEYRLNAIMDNSTALIYIKDLQGRYVMVNKRFRTFFGVSDKEILGATDYDFNSGHLADHFSQMDEQVILSRRPIETEELLDTPWGKRNLLLLKFPLLAPDGILLGVSGIATDVTDKTELQKETIIALQKAESAQQIQEQFLANMSHEIRTPMNGIQGMTRLLLQTKLTEEQKRFTNNISRSLHTLMVTVNNVLDFSKLRAGKLVLDNFVFNLPELLEELKKYFEQSLSNKQLSFLINLDKEIPGEVRGDAFRLKQILTNLIDNAVKFTNEGQIQLRLSLRSQNEKQARILFILSDTGIGIPKDRQQFVFESFAQASKHISSGYGGAGLGLTISKGLIEILGGKISVESEPGRGSVFSFELPFDITETKELIPAQNDPATLLAGKKILVVEDNPVNQRLIDFVLKKVNIEADMASNGKEAIALCEKNPGYELVIMDLQMPVMDGYEATQYIREKLQLQMPIIAMTATALKEDQERSQAVGMNDFMLKPFDFNDLYARLVGLLHHTEIKEMKEAIAAEDNKDLYDLSLLEELGDPAALLEVLKMFFENTPQEISLLVAAAKENNQPELYRVAHKLKSAMSTIQSAKLTALLRSIETNAKNAESVEESRRMVHEVVILFAQTEKYLRIEMDKIASSAGLKS